MTQVRKAEIYVEWHDRNREPKRIAVQYNPTEYTLEKSVQLAEVQIPGLDSPLQQFVRGQAEKLTLDLFFDTTEHGMGPGATSVTTETDKIYQLIKIEPERHAPPILTFVWSDQFPGSSVGGAPGSGAGALGRAVGAAAGSAVGSAVGGAISAVSAGLGNQRRNGFRCVLESVRQKFTLFSPEGVPLRATLTVTLREYKTLSDQLERLHLSSPDRTHGHVTASGDSLASIAQRHYESPGSWRPIADHNGIEDPRRLGVGLFLEVPRLE
jgi:hypothetical protein